MSAVFEADCLKLTMYFGERDRTAHGLLGDELMGLYARHRVRASVLLRGSEGFGGHHRLRSDRLLTLSEDLPLVSVAVDRRERMEALVDGRIDGLPANTDWSPSHTDEPPATT
jgi:PII-like signaling protein